ncbi:MAG: FapA family protein [Synergistaceae bacterium]|nr:FapA family protein [Synergistaceae bacterium]
MADDILKIEADSKGVWITALSDDFTLASVTNFLRNKGVRKYNEKAVEEFARQKNRDPRRIAERDPVEERHAVVVVHTSKDNMTASVSVEPPFFTYPWPSGKDVAESLERKSVVFGIDQEAIKKLTELKLGDEQVTVAQGKPAVNGKNSQIELLVNPDHAPETDQDAEKIDHKERSVFVSVKQGDHIAVKRPSTEGENGMTIAGVVIKAVPGKDIPFPIAGGLDVSEDGLQLTAAIDGRLTRKENKLVVLPVLEVKGDVDFSVGNVDFTGSVKILGAVREGFQVLAGGGIEIREVVEGARVESKSDIVIAGGIRGMSKGRIIAAGNVTAGFADQAYIRSNGEIRIKNSVFHSDVGAHNTITVMGGKKSQIAGGKIQAGVAVVCNTLGSEMGTKTEVTVGLPPEQTERRKELQASIIKHKESLEKLETNLTFLKKQEKAGTIDDSKRALMVAAMKSKFQMQAALKSMQTELNDLESRLDLAKSKGVVRVKEMCYPGVTVTIRGFTYAVREPIKFTAFVYDESAGEIKIRHFDY